jgi:hypothetical protein
MSLFARLGQALQVIRGAPLAATSRPSQPVRYQRVFVDPNVEALGPHPLVDPEYARKDPGDVTPQNVQAALSYYASQRWDTSKHVDPLRDLSVALDLFVHPEFDNDGFCDLPSAVVRAHATHQAIALSPEVLFWSVLQAMAQHIYRTDCAQIPLEDRQDLRVRLGPNEPHPPMGLHTVLADRLAQEVVGADRFGAQIMELVAPTGAYRSCPSVFNVMLLHAFKGRFRYFANLGACGIPMVVLEGSPDEWYHLAGILQKLREMEPLAPIAHWLSMMVELFNKLGSVDPDNPGDRNFMQRMAYYTPRTSAPSTLSGWIATLFPWYSDGDGLHWNPLGSLLTGDKRDLIAITKHITANAPVHVTDEASGRTCSIMLRAGVHTTCEAYDPGWNLFRPNLRSTIDALCLDMSRIPS